MFTRLIAIVAVLFATLNLAGCRNSKSSSKSPTGSPANARGLPPAVKPKTFTPPPKGNPIAGRRAGVSSGAKKKRPGKKKKAGLKPLPKN
ncbi:MAG: hypothetical protein IID45_04325 [Planctomycetes bacterium]|nr:hypothetical protein [Planctomycetota bacterium]